MKNKEQICRELIKRYEEFIGRLNPNVFYKGKIKEGKLDLKDFKDLEIRRSEIEHCLGELEDKEVIKYFLDHKNLEIKELVSEILHKRVKKRKNLLYRIKIIPKYTEVMLFLVTLVLVLLLITNSLFRRELFDLFFSVGGSIFSGLVVLVVGTFLSTYHIFSRRLMTRHEKQFMVAFAVFVNFIVGYFAGTYVLKELNGVWAIFPILNIASAALLLFLFRVNIIKEDSISDKQAKKSEIISGAILIFAIFIISQYMLGNYWAITFSICTSYATNLNQTLNKIFFLSKKC